MKSLIIDTVLVAIALVAFGLWRVTGDWDVFLFMGFAALAVFLVRAVGTGRWW